MTQGIRELLTPVAISFPSHDPQDLFMKDITSFSWEDLTPATHVLLGCPQDEGVARNHGRVGCAAGPESIRQMFYRLKPPAHHHTVRLYDLGNTKITGSLEDVHANHAQIVSSLLTQGKKVLVLGGGNDISYADGRALHGCHGAFTALNIDAHLDMRTSKQIHSGSPYGQLVREGLLQPENLHQIGTQAFANAPHYMAAAENSGVHIHPLQKIVRQGTTRFFTELLATVHQKKLFVGLDMDAIQASDAPAASATSPLGLSGQDIVALADLLHQHPLVQLFEITELNPTYDIDNRSATLAAIILFTFLFGLDPGEPL